MVEEEVPSPNPLMANKDVRHVAPVLSTGPRLNVVGLETPRFRAFEIPNIVWNLLDCERSLRKRQGHRHIRVAWLPTCKAQRTGLPHEVGDRLTMV